MYDEWSKRETSRARMQVEGPSLSTATLFPSGKSLGVYGLPIGDGEYIDPSFESKVNHISGLDTKEFHHFEPRSATSFEKLVADQQDIGSELAKKQSLFESLQFSSNQMANSLDRLVEMKQIAEIDRRQVQEELLSMEREQLGPPRRLPIQPEYLPIHERKDRVATIGRRIEDIQHTIEVSTSKKEILDKQILSIAKDIATLKSKDKDLKSSVDASNGGFENLPIVIGRSINKVPGINPLLAKPKELMNAVMMKSRWIDMKEKSEEALAVHKEVVRMDQKIWVARHEGSEVKFDADRVFNKLMEISERLKSSNVENLRLNIIDALKGFLARNIALKTVMAKVCGSLPWFNAIDRESSDNVARYISGSSIGCISFDYEDDENSSLVSRQSSTRSASVVMRTASSSTSFSVKSSISNPDVNDVLLNGVTLGFAKEGFCCGMITLPKEALWSIALTISPQGYGEEYSNAHETDSITIKFGTTFSSLMTIGVFYNKVNPHTGTVLHDVHHVFRGRTLAFRFEFTSSTCDIFRHLAICPGLYEEYEMKPVEVIPDPQCQGRERIISSFVKKYRADDQMGKFKYAKLLEELIDAEESKASIWDSELINNYPQRYRRDFFLRILRAEILISMHLRNQTVSEDASQFSKSKAVASANSTLKMLEKLEESHNYFIERKRKRQMHIVVEGEAKVGRIVELFEPESQSWKHCIVEGHRVKWIENGTKAQCIHALQEYDNTHTKIGDSFEVDLSQRRYYESPAQVLDESALRSLREQREWERRLAEIDGEAAEKTSALKIVYNKQIHEEEKKMKRELTKMIKYVDKHAHKEAQISVESPIAERILKASSLKVIREMKKGIVKFDPKKDIHAQAMEIAKSRFIDEWVTKRKAKVLEEVEERKKMMRQRVTDKWKEFAAFAKSVLDEAKSERYRLQWYLREKRAQDLIEMKARVRFDAALFRKLAVPQAQRCEHLRTKAWGDKYGKGVRCLLCGEELDDLFRQESQILGYGTGADPEFVDMLNRHRANDRSFRFKNTQELQMVEKERIRLEKERREMDENEQYFYDYDDLKAIYDFDRRHSRSLKEAGKFRQGIQWSEEEVELFEARKIKEKKAQLENEGKIVEKAIIGYDPLADIDNPPPTFRAQDDKRRSQYKEMMFMMGRLHTFRKKIMALKEERLGLLGDRVVFSRVLESLHKDSFGYDVELTGLEMDLDRTAKLLATYEKMEILWKQANRITAQAVKDKRKAELRLCGLWDDVKEAKDRLSFVHEETRSLLKVKFLLESKQEYHHRIVDERKAQLEKSKASLVDVEKAALALQYCMPGTPVITRYGDGFIRSYRSVDKMLLVSLGFGRPPAKLWIQSQEIIDADHARQQGEQLIMQMEDEYMKKFLTTESVLTKKERYLMQKEEEGMKEYYQFIDLGKCEDSMVFQEINKIVDERFEVTKTAKFRKIQGLAAKQSFKKFHDELQNEIKTYNGPASGRPKALSAWQRYQKRKEIYNELTQSFIQKAALRAEGNVKTEIRQRSFEFYQNYSFQQLMLRVIDDMIVEVADEAISEGRWAKLGAERQSGILFPHPMWMQFGTYHSLSRLWKEKKEELRRKIDMNQGLARKGNSAQSNEEMTHEELMIIREKRRKEKQERKRQRAMNEDMAMEEARCRAFYKWELAENLRERRMMRENEKWMRDLMKEEARQVKAATSNYAVSASIASKQKEITASNDFDRRRAELKDLTMERRKREEEQMHMIVEDQRGEALREVDRAERQAKKFLEEFGKLDQDEDNEEQEKVEVDQSSGLPIIKLPKWLKKPEDWEKWDYFRQRDFVKLHINVRMKHKRIEQMCKRDAIRLQRMEDKSYKEWSRLDIVVNQQYMEEELQALQKEEDLKSAEAELLDLHDNIRKISIYCREKGEEELKAKSEMNRKENLAKKREKELAEASAWLELCERRASHREKLKRRVTADCKWVDTDSIAGFHQRFRTELLRERLYWVYFRKIVMGIINRAETIATERKLMKIQEQLSANKHGILDRRAAMKDLWRDFQRDEYMRMRRSLLNEKFFPQHRKQVLRERFTGWVRFFMWNRGHREAFQMKYEIIKRQLDLDRQFKDQLSKMQTGKETKPIKSKEITTTLQDHGHRVVQCKLCLNFYLESQNHSMACMYHPMSYSVDCPKSCPNPGATPLCISHRTRRWRCCESTNQNIVGCSRRYHMPVPSDPVYDKIMEKINDRDKEMLETLDSRLDVARKSNWPLQLQKAKREGINSIEDNLTSQHQKAEKFYSIKFV